MPCRLTSLVNLIALFALAVLLALLPLRGAIVLGGIGAAGLVFLRWPWAFWLVPAVALPVASAVRMGPLTVTELLLGGALFLWLIAGAARRTLRTYHHALLAPLVFYLGVLAVSLLGAPDLGEAAKEMVKWVEFAAVLLVLPAVHSPLLARWLVAALLVAAAGQALLGLYQFISQVGPEWFVLFDRFMRASGSFRQPNPFAGYLGLTLPVAVSLTLWGLQSLGSGRRDLQTGACTLLYMGAAVMMAVALVASWSRGAWLGAAAAMVVVLVGFSRQTALLVAGALLTLTIAALFGALNPAWVPEAATARLQDLPAYFGFVQVLGQPVTDENFAILERLAHWVAALRMFALAPWLGIGPGNYAVLYAEVRLPLWEEALGHAHNIYLNVLAETGLLGFVAFVLFWGRTVTWVWSQRSEACSWQRALSVGVLGTLAHLFVHSGFDNLFVQGIYLHLAFWLAALALAATRAPACTRESEAVIC